MAALRQAIGDKDRRHVRADGFIERLRLSYAAGFSLALKPDSNGFDFDPVLFSPERLREAEDGSVIDELADGLLPPTQQASFARRFRRSDGGRRAFLLEDGSILFLDPALQRALTVVHAAQSGGAEARRAFARNPQRQIAEALSLEDGDAAAPLFVETQQFSERVSGIDIWRKPVLPWERATFTFDAQDVPATEQARAALNDLKGLIDAALKTVDDASPAPDAPPDDRRYFSVSAR